MAAHLDEPLSLLLIALILDAALSWLPVVREVQRAPADAVRGVAAWLDRRLNRERRSRATRFVRGLLVIVAIAALAWALGAAIHALAYAPRGARGIEVAAIWFLLFQRGAFDRARGAARALAEGDHTAARGAIEDLARAFVGGVVGVTFWYLVFGLAGAGLAGASLYRAAHVAAQVMRGGAFAAGTQRLNAMLGAIPAPIAGLLLALAAPFVPRAHPVRAIRIMCRDFGKHPSPDAGFTMAAVAGALGLALGGPTASGWIGDGRARAGAGDVTRACWLFAVAGLIHAGLLALALALIGS